ncbi:MAG TPA: phosphate acyltransferase PlsX [candidate division Zixibacteria bacterium]
MADKVRIGLDAMGGDKAPASIVEGALLASRDRKADYQVVLVGDKGKIQRELERLGVSVPPFEVVHASEVVSMDEPAAEAARKKKDSSLAVGMGMQKEGKLDGFVSGGNTGAVMATAVLTLGHLEGVDRPAIASYFPSEKDAVVVLDVGANADCKARNLYEFGVMGTIYTNYILKRENPRLGLLSIGEESTKGNELTLVSYRLLSESKLNFIGNVEGHDVLKGTCDVVVCDGFVGNIMLKFAESIESFLYFLIKEELRRSILFRTGAFLLKYPLRSLRKSLNYAEYGGAPLLGVDGVCIICHGKSSPKAIKNAVKLASKMVNEKVNEHIKEELRNSYQLEGKNGKSL